MTRSLCSVRQASLLALVATALLVLAPGRAAAYQCPADTGMPPNAADCPYPGGWITTPTSMGPPANFIGTSDPDCIWGTPGPDFIVGFEGDDIICGNGGDDSIFAGDGDDKVDGGPGIDFISGDNGADDIDGGDGNDTIQGGNGNDVIHGGAGNDLLDGQDNDDTIYGDAGADTIRGGAGVDQLNGGLGADDIKGGAGDDFIWGADSANPDGYPGDGADILAGDAGNDTIYGGQDNDTLRGGLGDDRLRGGDGDDTLYGYGGTDPNYAGSDKDDLQGGAGDDKIYGEKDDDTIIGGTGNDTIEGGDGVDTISGNAGTDTISGGAGDDIISGGDDPDALHGDAGNDTIHGDGGDDLVDGGSGADTLYGEGGNDRLVGGPGIDSFDGGAGTANNCPDYDAGTETQVDCDLFTVATLRAFDVRRAGGDTIVHWSTATEDGTLGFYVYRVEGDARRPVAGGILPGLLSAPQGGDYYLVDAGAPARGAVTYALVELDASGATNALGTFTAEPSRGERPGALDAGATYARVAHPLGPAAPALVVAKADAPVVPADAVQVLVERPGLVEVSATTLAERLGLSHAEVAFKLANGQLAITSDGAPVAWKATADGLRFYGDAPSGLYAKDRVYRVTLGDGVQMRSVASGSLVAEPLAGLPVTAHAEQNLMAATVGATDPDADVWVWGQLYRIGANSQPFSFDLPTPHATGLGTATLRVSVVGASDDAHTVAVTVNGQPVGSFDFTGKARFTGEVSFDAAALNAGSNTVQLEETAAGTANIVNLDAVDLDYARDLDVFGDADSVRVHAADETPIRVTGVPASSTPMVLDVTDPTNPRPMIGVDLQTAGELRFGPEAGHDYLVLTAAAVGAPVGIRSDFPPDLGDGATTLSDARNAADYVVIAPAPFLDQAARLAAHRAQQGLRTAVVDLQDIYDEFSFGEVDPHAIRAFLKTAYETWATPPRFVVLAGAGTIDPKDYQGKGGDLVPVLLTYTETSLVASDNRFGDVEGDDGVPEIAVGRLPARTDAELSAFVDRLIDYDQRLDQRPDKVVLVASRDNNNSNFTGVADSVASLVPAGTSAEKLYRDDLGLDGIRTAYRDALSDGALLVDYFGHSGIDHLSAGPVLAGGDETLLGVDEVAGMTVSSPPPLITNMTCDTMRFEVPGVQSVGQAMSLAGAGVALWGASGRSENSRAATMSRAFVKALFDGSSATLSDAIDAAFDSLDDSEISGEMIRTYVLFGDPATRLRDVAGTPGTDAGVPLPDDGTHGGDTNAAAAGSSGGCSFVPMHATPRSGGPLALSFLLLGLVWWRRRRRDGRG